MFHPDEFFVSLQYATLDLRQVLSGFERWQKGKPRPVKAPTWRKYEYSCKALFDSMERNALPLELRYLHPYGISTWIAECRSRGQSEDGIASTLVSVKVFANAYVFDQCGYTIGDPLKKVPRITPPEKEFEILDDAELERILNSFPETYEGIRSRAGIAILMGTGARLREMRELTLPQWDPSTCQLTLHGKGDRWRYAQLSPRVTACLKAYLKIRPR
jgi:site-specific recombinase XerD